MCTGGRLVADFVAGTDEKPRLPEEVDEHLTTTMNGLWVVWAHKLAQLSGDEFKPLTGGSDYPANAAAQCRRPSVRGNHDAPDPECTCGFHALSSWRLPGFGEFPADSGLMALTVALYGRVLAFEWPLGGVLWRAQRQTVVRVERVAGLYVKDGVRAKPRRSGEPGGRPGEPDGRPAVVKPAAPRDSGPVRLSLPASPPVLPIHHDDAGWCAVSSPIERPAASLVLV